MPRQSAKKPDDRFELFRLHTRAISPTNSNLSDFTLGRYLQRIRSFQTSHSGDISNEFEPFRLHTRAISPTNPSLSDLIPTTPTSSSLSNFTLGRCLQRIRAFQTSHSGDISNEFEPFRLHTRAISPTNPSLSDFTLGRYLQRICAFQT